MLNPPMRLFSYGGDLYTHSDSNCGFEPLKIVINSGLHRLVNHEPVFFEKIGYRLSKLFYGAKEFVVSDRFIHNLPKPLYGI